MSSTDNPAYRDRIVVPITADAADLDDWLRSVRILVSQVGFALDNYLATRPSPEDAL